MPIAVGAKVPDVKIKTMVDGKLQDVSTGELFAGKKAVLFAVPGAFTPTCSMQHLPGFVANAKTIKAKGVDLIACISVNDAFVMDAWGKTQGPAGSAVMMLADGNAEFTKAMGLEMDGTGIGFGTRSQRYAAVIENGVIKALNVEKPMKFECSSADAILDAI
jgi:glutaredoxin/glutathione-dependent peroxiredoxin